MRHNFRVAVTNLLQRYFLFLSVLVASSFAIALLPVSALAGSQTYSTPGTYTFTVPTYASTLAPSYGYLTVQLWGAGGSGSNGYYAVVYGAPGGNATFNGTVTAGGGNAGGPTSDCPYDGCSNPGSASGGTASGGDVNTSGGSADWEYGGSSPNGGSDAGFIYNSYGLPGGAPGGGGGGGHSYGPVPGGLGGGGGAYAEKTYSVGALTPGQSVQVVIGAGGVDPYTGSEPCCHGGTGGSGEVSITWTDPSSPLVCIPTSSTTNSATFTTPGTCLFAIPSYSTLTTTVSGAGGGGGGAGGVQSSSCGKGCTSYAGTSGSSGAAGSLSSFDSTVIGNGGGPGGADPGNGSAGSAGSAGTASGGSTDTSGGGNSGSTGPNNCNGTQSVTLGGGGQGGAGGNAIQTYGAGALSGYVVIVVGTGGTGGGGGNGDTCVGSNASTATNGQVVVSWTSTPSCTVSLSPNPITNGGSSTLSWTTSNSPEWFYINNVGYMSTSTSSGSFSVAPSTTTDYTCTVADSSGNQYQTPASLTVNQIPMCTLSVSPTSITQGNSSTLTYFSQNVSSFSITPSVGTVTLNATGTASVSPSSTTQYTGSVIGAGGSNSCTVPTSSTSTVSVSCAPSNTCSGSELRSKVGDGMKG